MRRPDITTSAKSIGPEFKRVVAGHGPCNKERLEARRKAWDDGAWVREAAAAHAQKRASRKADANTAAA